jgi:hypothetical protein
VIRVLYLMFSLAPFAGQLIYGAQRTEKNHFFGGVVSGLCWASLRSAPPLAVPLVVGVLVSIPITWIRRREQPLAADPAATAACGNELVAMYAAAPIAAPMISVIPRMTVDLTVNNPGGDGAGLSDIEASLSAAAPDRAMFLASQVG